MKQAMNCYVSELCEFPHPRSLMGWMYYQRRGEWRFTVFYIRADGNTAIGVGHVMRCLSVAEAAKKLGAEKLLFLLADDTCCSIVARRGFEAEVLGTDYRKMQQEIRILARILHKEDVILVDSYQVTPEYFRELRQLCRVACFEDMGKAYPVDLLINYNIYAPRLLQNYEQIDAPDRVLLGVEYMPLREEFSNDRDYVIRNEVTDIMITTGGSDPCFAAGIILEGIWDRTENSGGRMRDNDRQKENRYNKLVHTGIRYHVVSGLFNSFAAELKAKCVGRKNVTVHENVSDMKNLMKQCDVVITATGSTLYEVSALGIPMICFYFAENQRQGAEELAELTEIVNVGKITEDRERGVSRILDTLLRCVCDKDYRERLSLQERALIDGKGAIRLAEQILKLK